MHKLAAPIGLEEAATADVLFHRWSEERPAILFRPPGTIALLAWLVRGSACLNLVGFLLHPVQRLLHHLAAWAPFEIAQGWPVRMLLTSVLLFVLASGLARGKRAAWVLTIISLTVAPLLHCGPAFMWPQAAVNAPLLVLLLFHHRYFVIRSDWESIRLALIICPLTSLALLIFGSIRLHHLRFETSGGDDWISCIQTAFELVLAHHSVTQQAQTLASAHFFVILRTGGTLIALVGLTLFLRPVLIRHRRRSENREKVRQLVEQHGNDPLDPYALLSDKSYFFTANGRVAIPYVLSGKQAVALADPIGPPAQRTRAIAEFAQFCRRQDWDSVFYEITDELIPAYQEAEFQIFKIGEEACLRAEDFHLRGGAFQNLRTACNSARKRGFRFFWYDAAAGIDDKLESELAAISQRWLQGKKTLEMSFAMGGFSLEEIRRHGAAVALDASGRAFAFATWRPFGNGTGRALDLMRCLPQGRNIMDFVLVESILHFRARGIREISLGSAPLANARQDGSRLQAEEKVVQFLFENLNRIYGYKSLFEFKRKYRPKWRSRYIAYRRGTPLPLIGLALVRIHAPGGLWKFLFC